MTPLQSFAAMAQLLNLSVPQWPGLWRQGKDVCLIRHGYGFKTTSKPWGLAKWKLDLRGGAQTGFSRPWLLLVCKCHSLSLSSLKVDSKQRVWVQFSYWEVIRGEERAYSQCQRSVFSHLPLQVLRDHWEPVWNTSELFHLRGMGASHFMPQTWVGIILGLPQVAWVLRTTELLSVDSGPRESPQKEV